MNPQLGFVEFCERVLGVTLEPGQRVFWSVAADGVEPRDLEGDDRELALQIFGEDVDEVPAAARRHVATIKGADVGWSFVGGLRLLFRALTADLHDAAQGEVRPALVVAPDLRLGRIPVRAALGAAESVPEIKRRIESSSSDGFVLRREGGRKTSVECLPASVGGRALRGRRYVEVFFDESAFFRDSNYAVNDLDCRRAAITRCTGTFWQGSTPWLESADVWKSYEANFGAPSTALAARLPTLVVRTDPRVVALVEAERERDPEGSRVEYDCEPVFGGEGAFFGADLLSGALVDDLNPSPHGSISIGGDVGLVKDSSAFVAVRRMPNGVIELLDVLELRPKKGAPLRLSQVVLEGVGFAAKHGARTIEVDHHVLEPAREYLPAGFHFEPAPGGQEAKFERFAKVRTEMRAGNVHIMRRHPRLVNQLALVVAKPQPGGGTSITMPRRGGSHGDVASAFVLAVARAATSNRDREMLQAIREVNASARARSSMSRILGDGVTLTEILDQMERPGTRAAHPVNRVFGRRGQGFGRF